MRDNFRHLIEAYCKLSGLDDPQGILDGGAIEVDGVVFSLVYSESVNPNLLFIYCDFGEVAPAQRTEAYRALLEANLYLYTGKGPAFTISGENGRVVFADQFPLAKSTPESLHDVLADLAAKARIWRADYCLAKGRGNRIGSASARLLDLIGRNP